jgi:carbon monoxide dehydrogenase subunit G
MKLSDEREIMAPREAVWAGITDPETLKACIPGCEEMTGSVEEGFEATVVQKVGPVKAKFKGKVTLSDVVEGQSCTITGEGKGGPAGFAKGASKVTLSEIEGGTRLGYDVEAKVGGKLAQLGGRVVDGVATRMADQFFDRFKSEIEGPGAMPPTTAEPVPAAAATPAAPAATATPEPAAPTPAAAAAPTPATTAPVAAGVSAEPAPAGVATEAGPQPEKKGWLRRLLS